jgi:hypothetical protein
MPCNLGSGSLVRDTLDFDDRVNMLISIVPTAHLVGGTLVPQDEQGKP